MSQGGLTVEMDFDASSLSGVGGLRPQESGRVEVKPAAVKHLGVIARGNLHLARTYLGADNQGRFAYFDFSLTLQGD